MLAISGGYRKAVVKRSGVSRVKLNSPALKATRFMARMSTTQKVSSPRGALSRPPAEIRRLARTLASTRTRNRMNRRLPSGSSRLVTGERRGEAAASGTVMWITFPPDWKPFAIGV
jgi:hypothetical protein